VEAEKKEDKDKNEKKKDEKKPDEPHDEGGAPMEKEDKAQ